MNFYPGEHLMDSMLIVANVSSFSMRATENATIFCTLPWCHPSFVFHDLETVQMKGITFNGCEFILYAVTGKVEIVKSSFVNHTAPQCGIRGGVLIFDDFGPVLSVLFKQCTFSDNTGESGVIVDYMTKNLTVDQCTFKNNHGSSGISGAIFKPGGFLDSHVRILNSYFIHNKAKGEGGAVSISAGGSVHIANCHFIDNVAEGRQAGAVMASSSQVIITKSYFSNNVARSNSGYGGALSAYVSEGGLIITDSYFSDNAAGPISGNGGAVYTARTKHFQSAISTNQLGYNIIISGNTFANNLAIGGGGGAIMLSIVSDVFYQSCSISLKGNTFIHNMAAYCGAVQITRDNRYCLSATISKNTFTHNSAVGKVAGNDTGGALCIRNASYALVLDNTFSHNTAAGNAGVMQADNSDITIRRSTFSSNVAGGDGGVLFTRSLPTNYTITDSNFTYNKAGGDGGVLYIETAKSQVKIRRGNFAFNQATDRGGAIAINGTDLSISGASVCEENTAKLGGVVSACKSKVKISNPNIPPTPDPVYSFCSLYDCTNAMHST